MGRMTNRKALVTGASRGIGKSVVESFLKEGAQVALVSTRQETLLQLCREAAWPTDRVLCIGADVSVQADAQRAVQTTLDQWGHIDVLVNNAGIYHGAAFLDHRPEDFQRLLDVNLFGVLHFMQACLPAMQQRRQGAIINIASTAGKWGSRNQSAYNTSKHAVVGLTRCVALEASAHQVTVNAICPGFVETDMVHELKAKAAQSTGASEDEYLKTMMGRVPLGRLMQPNEIAELAVFLASDAARGITGQSIHIDGGMVM